MTREGDRRLDALLDSAPQPQVPEDLARRIAARVTSLPQEKAAQPIVLEQAPLESKVPPSRRRRRVVFAVAAAIIGLAALSVTAGRGSQTELRHVAEVSPAVEMPVTDQLAAEVLPVLDSPGQPGAEAVPLPQHSAPPIIKQSQELALDTVEKPALEMLGSELKADEGNGDKTPEAVLANAPIQGPEIADGIRRTATPYGPPAGEGLGITGASLPRAGRPGAGSSPMPPPGPPK